VTDGSDQERVGDFRRLRDACIDLRVLSNEFKRLFSDEDKLTLDAVGPAVFQVIHLCMIEVWWLRAGRLMDPAKSPGHENLTFANILGRMDCEVVACDGIQTVWQSLQASWEKMKPARNRQIAHSDLKTSRQDAWLGSISEDEGEKFENNLQDLCDLIGTKLGVGPLDFRSSGCAGDASDLMGFLKFGLRARDTWRHTQGRDTSVQGMYRDQTDQ